MNSSVSKLPFQGNVLAVQPRIRLLRSFDERSHSYLGYVLRIKGTLDSQEKEFLVGVGKAAHEKHQFRAGDEVSGEGETVVDTETETVDIYKVSKLKVTRGEQPDADPPPYFGVSPSLKVYRQRGHRRLDARTYENKCTACIWGALMAVEIIIDHWKPSNRRYRRETFCYGPKICELYKAGPTRKVPGRKGMTLVEENWIDEDATSHRGPDE